MELALGGEHVAHFDDADWPSLSGYRWRAVSTQYPHLFYAVAELPRVNGKRSRVRMHRVVMGLGPDDPMVDHKDHDGLNNRRSNLRLADHSQNGANRVPSRIVRYRGVSWNRRDRKWQAHICVRGERRALGYFDDPVQAAVAYDTAAREGWGEFAQTNF